MLKEKENTTFTIDPKTAMGKVTLGVADLAMMTDFYTKLIGLTMLSDSSSSVELGVDDMPLLRLEERPNGRQYPNSVGLFHIALLLPSRPDLGRWLQHLSANNYSLTGASDHLVSEALYLDDPEGNGIEIYRDRPRETWNYANGMVQMDTLRLDLQALLADAHTEPFEQMPSGTVMGHVHLRVDEVPRTSRFYQEALGFDVMFEWPEAGFLSAGGYHHHLGMNVWRSQGSTRPPEGSLGLIHYEIALPDAAARDSLLTRLDRQDMRIDKFDNDFSVIDPSGNRAVLTLQ